MMRRLLATLTLAIVLRDVEAIPSGCTPLPAPATAAQASTFAGLTLDYLIVGGGTAGLTIASRLTENSKLRVGVLEAGVYRSDDLLIDVPGNSGRAGGNPSYDWAFSTTPQPGGNGRSIATPRGKMLGGSSGLNLMAWNRGSKAEYDAWDSFAPGGGWNWNGLQSYFAKSQNVAKNQQNPYPGATSSGVSSSFTHGSGNGPIHPSYNVIYPDTVTPYVQTYNNLGIQTNSDADNGNASGIYNTRAAIDRSTGNRTYAATGYYCQASRRSNLHVLVGAEVTKVLLAKSGSTYTATGVSFTAAGQSFTVKARKEVILSASTIKTPQLLELSGIGNSDILQSVGITPLINLPGVGENLQEHLFSPIQFQLTPGHHTWDELRNNLTFATQQWALYNTTKTGYMTNIDSSLAFVPPANFAGSDGAAALLQAFDTFVSQSNPTPLQQQQYKLQRAYLTQGLPHIEIICLSRGVIAPQQDQSYLTLLVGIQHPVARGSVHISSSSAATAPTINGNYLSNDYDAQTLLRAIKFAVGLKDNQPLASHVAALNSPTASTDDDILGYIRATFSPGSHISGTAVMAPRNIGGVVDKNLIVYGTKNLRVVDASIFPLLMAAHTQSTVYAIAEKAATLIAAAA
ncbi:hypothetical protein HGRIS_014580 [Hohenbuehelia grisea]|uniref:Glucose-methanol-choline oxidoreductase N-terminal domain-containing protein n=1 Tax=Hohenbuehelia grisea TaxID=104357 RepID=A0ABR3JVP0_9AGAR